jgi:transcriptional regulator with XRE-family HTH domain
MRQFPNKIRKIISKSGLNINTISKTSGISNTYLNKLIQGNINRPGKDKIASTLLALNFTIGEINTVLADYDYRPLSSPDIAEILNNNNKRKIEGNTLPLYESIHGKLLLAHMERLGGDKILAKDTPSVLFMPEKLYIQANHSSEESPDATEFYMDLMKALFRERKKVFYSSIARGCRFETFICRDCLERYLARHLDPALDANGGHRRLIVQYFANVLGAIKRNPDQHRMRIVERCCYFVFQIQGIDRKNPKVFFFGKQPVGHRAAVMHQALQGFASDAATMIVLFEQEAELSRRTVNSAIARNYPANFSDYIYGLFEQQGLGRELATAADEVGRGGELLFF